jgi:hypothetical protein
MGPKRNTRSGPIRVRARPSASGRRTRRRTYGRRREPAVVQPVGSDRSRQQLSKEKTIALSEELKNNKDIQGLITGLQLGDSTIQLIGKNARLRICMKDKAFVDHIYFKALGIVGAEPYQSKSIIEPSGNTRITYQFQTYTLPYLTEQYSLWYKRVEGENVKIIPSNIRELLTPLAFAYWLAGDGSFNQLYGCIIICTDSFTRDEVDLLRSALLDNFGNNSTRNVIRPNQYRIRISSEERRRGRSPAGPALRP